MKKSDKEMLEKANNRILKLKKLSFSNDLFNALYFEKKLPDISIESVEKVLNCLKKTILNPTLLKKVEAENNTAVKIAMREDIENRLQALLFDVDPELKINNISSSKLSSFYIQSIYPAEKRDKSFATKLESTSIEAIRHNISGLPF